MSTAEPAVRTVAPAGVPAPRPAPVQEDRRRHDGYYWDVDACGWQRSAGR
jgi:hypothetical protein